MTTSTLKLARADFGRITLPPLEALFFCGAGLAVLLIGSWTPDPRLNIEGLPLDILVMIGCTIIATTGSIRKQTLKRVAIAVSPLIILAASILWSPVPELGLNKWSSVVISGTLGFVLLNTVVERKGEDELARSLVFYLGALLVAAFFFKLIFGFFDRGVAFLFNGPIVFARFMCVAALMSIAIFKGKTRTIIVTLFVLSILWTESKGPILAIVVSLILLRLASSTPRQRFLFLLATIILAIGFLGVLSALGFTAKDLGRLGFYVTLLTGDFQALATGVNYGSVGTRAEMWAKTIPLIFNHPFGVGLAGWDTMVSTRNESPYPHNLFLELWSEAGVILGSIASIPFLIFLFVRKNIFWFVASTLLLAQMVSGDIADARVLLVFSLLACFSKCRSVSVAQYGTRG